VTSGVRSMKKNLLGSGSNIGLMVAAATLATTAEAAPVTVNATLTLSQILSSGQFAAGTFDINPFLQPPTDFNQPYDIFSATITAYGYAPNNSSTQYGSYGPNQNQGTSYSQYGYSAPYVNYYSYSNNYSYSYQYVSGQYTNYNYAVGTSDTTTQVSQRNVTTTDSVDTLSLDVGTQSATDQTLAVISGPTPSNLSYGYTSQGAIGYNAYIGNSQYVQGNSIGYAGGSCGWGCYYSYSYGYNYYAYTNGYNYYAFITTGFSTTNYYLQDLYSASIANGPMSASIFLSSNNIADLALDGLLNFSIVNLGGYFSADQVTLSVTLNANPDDVPEPESWAILLGGIGIASGLVGARRRKVRER